MDFIEKIIDMDRNKNIELTETLMNEGPESCIEKGLVPLTMYTALKMNKKAIESDLRNEEFLSRDVKQGMKIPMRFKNKNVTLEVVGALKDQGHNAILENINDNDYMLYFPLKSNSERMKKKHYYIYSRAPNYGKSIMAYGLRQHLNADVVTDPNNFEGVRENAQFLIFDEYGLQRKLKLDHLKLLTCGNGSFFGGNRKTAGASYVPRDDVQIIILSNVHLYEIYADVWDNKEQKRYISQATADMLDTRFQIIKLDENIESAEDDVRNLIWNRRYEDDDCVMEWLPKDDLTDIVLQAMKNETEATDELAELMLQFLRKRVEKVADADERLAKKEHLLLIWRHEFRAMLTFNKCLLSKRDLLFQKIQDKMEKDDIFGSCMD